MTEPNLRDLWRGPATADSVARYHTVSAWLGDHLANENVNSPDLMIYVAAAGGAFATAFLLREFAEAAPDAADRAARALVGLMEAGELPEELHEWLVEYGYDPAAIRLDAQSAPENRR